MKSVVIDILGGDNNMDQILIGTKDIYERIKNEYTLVLAGPKSSILNYFSEEEIVILDTDIDVLNTTNPMGMLHDLENTALVKAYTYLKENDDCVGLLSVASTGCILVGSIFKLGLIKGIKSPVLASELYDKNGNKFILVDCGANLDVNASQLVDFGKIGNAYMKSMGYSSPKVGLANVGVEKGKGNKQMKEAYSLLEESNLNFIGNIEFNNIFEHDADVLVCDGAIGNSILKTAEGAAMTAVKMLKNNPDAAKLIDDIFNYTDNGAALLLGPKKLILKAHGAATNKTIVSSLEQLIRLDKNNMIESLKKEFN